MVYIFSVCQHVEDGPFRAIVAVGASTPEEALDLLVERTIGMFMDCFEYIHPESATLIATAPMIQYWKNASCPPQDGDVYFDTLEYHSLYR